MNRDARMTATVSRARPLALLTALLLASGQAYVVASAADNDVLINIHIGSGNAAPHASLESPIDAWITTMPISIVNSAADWLHLDALKRYPLKVSLSEGGIGWIPYLLERADYTNQQHKAWTHSETYLGKKKPSDVFRQHFTSCFIDDAYGLRNVDLIGEDNIISRSAMENIGGRLTEAIDYTDTPRGPVLHVVYEIDRASFASGPLVNSPSR